MTNHNIGGMPIHTSIDARAGTNIRHARFVGDKPTIGWRIIRALLRPIFGRARP